MTISQRRLFEAVCWICPEIMARSAKTRKWAIVDEADLWHELIACTLGSQVSFEVAQAAAERLKSADLASTGPLYFPEDFEKAVADCLRGSGYRFPALRARQIRQTRQMVYGSGKSLRSLLENAPSAQAARIELVSRISGIGPKQASLFLRNIGFTLDLAILDAHVLRYMNFMGIGANSQRKAAGALLTHYVDNETALREHATDAGYAIGHMDWAIWIVMRSIRSAELAWT